MAAGDKLADAVPVPRGDRPLAVGYLAPFLTGGVNAPRWLGVFDAARAHGISLLAFPGGYYQGAGGTQAAANVLYGMISRALDGILIGNVIREDVTSPAEIRAFYDGLNMPVVSLRESLPGIPYVALENCRAMREAILHLIQVHGRRRLVFLRGPEGHPYAEERLQAYFDALGECGIAFDPDLVTPPSDWQTPSMQLLLDTRGLRPGVDFDAVVGVNDDKALDALQTLQAHGVRVAAEVAVIGFNDHERARVAAPALTTVRPAFYEQGQQALGLLISLLAGQSAPEEVPLPVHLVVRESCGCIDPLISQADVGSLQAAEIPLQEALVARQGEIVAAMVEAAAATAGAAHAEWAASLLDRFAAEFDGTWPGIFLDELNEVLRRAAATADASTSPEQRVAAWHGAISALRRLALPYLLGSPAALRHAENLWQQARIVIGKAVERVQALRNLETRQREEALQHLGTRLVATFNLPNLLNVLAEGLPRLEIPSFYLALYESPQPYHDSEPVPAWSRLVLAYEDGGRKVLPAGGVRFPTCDLLPQELRPWQQQPCSLIIEPLYLQRQQLGFVVLQVGPREPGIYEALRAEIANALQGALLVEQVERHALRLRTAAGVSHAISSILDLDALSQQVVDLLGERFDLHHVGIFLIDHDGTWTGEAGRWVVMRAGAGAMGREVAAQGFKVELSDRSLIGWCARHGQPRLVAGADADAAHTVHPLFPETRSELVLPLRIGERVAGVLDVQSRKEDAFDPDYQQALQTVADQLAVAVENARGMEAMRRLNAHLEEAMRAQERLLETVRALSTPVMPLLEGVVLLPVVGHVDSQRAQQIMDGLLGGVEHYHAQIAIVDITGVALVDTAVANSLVQAAQAVNLLGAEVVLVGMRPEVAQTVVGLGVDLTRLVTMSDLQSGIQYALRRRRGR